MKKRKKNSLEKLYLVMIYSLPGILFFSYYPLIHFGSDGTMNFEISLPLIWLVLFDLLGLVLLIKKKRLFNGLKNKWILLILPTYITLSVVWSLNAMRGFLTAGIMWLICAAGYVMFELRDLVDDKARVRFLKCFMVSTLVICGWCVLQCILDLVGVGREYTLMCVGCTYRMFGFPHPNGLAIEPQFMGNLLLAPAMVCMYLFFRKQINKNLAQKSSRGDSFYNGSGRPAPKLSVSCSVCDRCKNYSGSDLICAKFLLICFLIITTTLFLTFSRGAIYSFIVGAIFISTWVLVAMRKEWKRALGRVGLAWGMIIISFIISLNGQGIMAAVSPTNDTYVSGVTKVLSHLSLGIIDVRGAGLKEGVDLERADLQDDEGEILVVEKPVENFIENDRGNEAVFDGYVAESTDTRLKLTAAAVEVWRRDFKTVLFGVGLGGAGRALYENGLSPSPMEIVQNEYASLLLETGIIGVSLSILTGGFMISKILRQKNRVLILGLIVAYGVSYCFFAGLANALQIFLMPMILMVIFGNRYCYKKSL
ncbi:O-antigen ligase family protein [Candidatus Saccharibacteria bacterium]|nr:O-antigen ligase family protein [Candidatus Saccharibacteria bacterium]